MTFKLTNCQRVDKIPQFSYGYAWHLVDYKAAKI